MASYGRVRVEGLKELRKELRTLERDGTWKTELRDAGKAAAEVVAAEARSRAARGATTISGTHATMGSAAIASIRALAGQTRATVAGGRASIPYFGGWNFGSGGAHRQFPRTRRPDYTLYSALGDKRSEVVEVYRREIDQLTSRHFGG